MHKKSSPAHFHGKDPLSHVIEARRKGATVTSEIHGAELPGHYSAAADSAKETAFLFTVLWTLFSAAEISLSLMHWLGLVFLCGWLLWRTGRSAILGWARLERLHRLIEEERWEIEHHRAQEKEELRALYAAKGFSGKLLDEAVEVLMADDNRLLQVMLEEELGLDLNSFEHPLKQAAGSFVGAAVAGAAMALCLFFSPEWTMPWSLIALALLIIATSSVFVARFEKNRLSPAVVWNTSVAALATGTAYFLGLIVLQK
ncbi:MAG TPA: VIT1/CCC1 transporter family protein [Chlamydiales bacterium]|jgi:hypothetical protein